MLYQQTYFSELLKNLSIRSERAAQGLLGLGNPHLRQFLHEKLTAAAGTAGAWLADPVFEPTFGWQESSETMDSLAGGNLLHQRLAKAMASPPKDLAQEYAFPNNRHPFTHQLAAWQVLNSAEPQSLVVTSGTGSGKTECFLVPVLNQLAQELDTNADTEGVRALFIYPLNALINSQQNRLDAWTDGFNGQIRHCLYTGALDDNQRKVSADQKYKGQVIDRKSLRARPPQLLVTNATMLEYMLIRKDDEPILEKSAGKLRWIILDEAHTHIGSQAAEMALLLRRVMLAFAVKPQDVRFVATSATFGSDAKTIDNLRHFLADIGGVAPEQVHVVQGQRDVPCLQPLKPHPEQDQPELIAAIEREQEQSALRYQRLEVSLTARRLRSLFVDAQIKAQTLSQLAQSSSLAPTELLAWLDLMSGTKNAEGLAFLPLRAHLFHNVIPSIRACVDRDCPDKANTALAHDEWPFGMVYLEDRTHCSCGAPLMPLVSCEECNESFLQASTSAQGKLVDPSQQQSDEFSLNEEFSDTDQPEEASDSLSLALITKPVEAIYPEYLNRSSHKFTADGSKDDSITLHLFSSDKSECPCCGATGHKLFRAARIGTPFTLSTVISTLLEFCPPDPAPLDKPFQGRKLISFTDSRQGTARIAVKLQQDSERNRIRGLVYHRLLQSQSQPSNTLTDEELRDLDDLQGLAAGGPLTGRDQRYLQSLLEKQHEAAKEAEISWTDMVNHLAGTPELTRGMLDYYNGLAPNTFGKDDSRNLAGMLLAREFYRRPKRANSLETLGLVQVCYPKLATITSKPTHWPKDVESWRNYLKVLMDFFVRENSILNIDSRWLSLIGARIRPKWVVAPVFNETTKKLAKGYIRWPTVNTVNSLHSRAVLLLCKAFNWEATRDQDRIDLILNEAWVALSQKAKLLISSGDGYQFKLEDLSFRLPKQVYLCPVSRRFIDTPFEGLSPYTPRTDRRMVVKAEPYPRMPRFHEHLLHLPGDERLLAIRNWLDTDEPQIQDLRKQALWSDISDRINEGGNYFCAAEHSAQQPKNKLDKYEAQFKAGKLNLLSCSTTMEMGVDIGGISVVAMNNVPPHPANYLQRAGRAGRRREGRSLALAVCKNTPHDQSVFHTPLWPFTTAMRMPKVSLQSPELVQRHINAWLLSHWLKQVIAAEEIKAMTSGAFFLDNGMPLQSLAKRFVRWCENQAQGVAPPVAQAIKDITQRSILASAPQPELLKRARYRIDDISQSWLQQHAASQAQLQQIENQKAAAYRAMDAQLKRITGEYLLSELANKRFLPGYGFPTDIVSFDNCCKETWKSDESTQREDNRARYRSLASRDRITGLREYAPGAELVMDGLVYKSSGITLNWHAPASVEHIKELQLFKKAWRCGRCGASDTAINASLELNCQECGTAIERDKIQEYLVPAGFAVDFFDQPHNDISSLQYIPVETPWLNIPARWISLANPALGQFRTSQQSQLFHYCSGANQKGFAICLECGKAEPMLSCPDPSASANEQYLPAIFREKAQHKRLRGGKNDNGENICSGSHNSWKIKQYVHLGHDSLTDALELILRDPNGNLLNDEVTGYSIAVALREAIAASLGIQTEELGCDCHPIRVETRPATAIRVFDLHSGGYTTLAAEQLNDANLWQRVIERLSNCNCSHACQHCLLSFDTRFEADRLDRHAALKWINQTWLTGLALPAALQVFGPDSQAEITTLHEAVERELAQDNSSKTIGIYLSSPAETWDLAVARRLRHQLLNWAEAGHQVQLHLPDSTFAALPADQTTWLAKLAANEIQICLYNTTPSTEPLQLNLSLSGPKANQAWASDTLQLTVPDLEWNLATAGATLVTGPAPTLPTTRHLSYTELLPAANPELTRLELKTELDGDLKGFADRLWQYLSDKAGPLLQQALTGQDPIVALMYTDRYVCNPWGINLLVSLIHELEQRSKAGFSIQIQGRQYQKNDSRTPWQCHHDWRTSTERDDAIRQALEYCGLTGTVISQPTLAHYRQLRLQLHSGKRLIFQFDQGLSYWEANRSEKSDRLKFNFSTDCPGEAIMTNIQCSIKTRGDEPTQIFITTD